MKKISKHRMVMKKQVEQVFYEREILIFAENPFVVGLWCTFQTKVYILYMCGACVYENVLVALLEHSILHEEDDCCTGFRPPTVVC